MSSAPVAVTLEAKLLRMSELLEQLAQLASLLSDDADTDSRLADTGWVEDFELIADTAAEDLESVTALREELNEEAAHG